MKNLNHPPKNLPLILILIGTTLLAIPAAIGTIALLDTSSSSFAGVKDLPGQILFCISVGGFGLYAGYILTAIFRRHSSVFWFCSMLYNFGLSCGYIYIFFAELKTSPARAAETIFNALSNPYFLILFWTIFVTIASGYYFRFAVRPKNLDLS